MKIAVFHNIETGGAKRAVFEHAQALCQRGHILHLFTPTGHADGAFLPLAPLCEKVFTYDEGHADANLTEAATASTLGGDEGNVRQIARRFLGTGGYEAVRDAVWVQKQEQKRARLTQIYKQMARDIAAQNYDVLYAHQCTLTLAPPLLSLVREFAPQLPVVFYCQDTLRRFFEWPQTIAPEYERLPVSTFLRRKRWGRVVSPVLAAYEEREQARFVRHLQAAPFVLANSRYSREAFVKSTGVVPRVNYLGVNAEFFCPDAAQTQTENEVLCVGALRPEKRHEFIIDVVGTIEPARRPRVRIVGYGMAGTGAAFADALLARAHSQSVALTIEREVTDETLRAAYRRARVFAFAPRLEPFGLVVLESLACGTPAIVGSEGGPREIVQNGVTGFVADPSDPIAFGAALLRVTSDAALRADVSRAGRADILARWTWEKSADFAEAVLREAAHR